LQTVEKYLFRDVFSFEKMKKSMNDLQHEYKNLKYFESQKLKVNKKEMHRIEYLLNSYNLININ